ncbi:methyl-accepting chemotaxis protein [Oligoflexus tunisiensis]|uniref:methyl-accepting chemotaxis protein n=1 Tax=Oligoflexus tunisiensis TaxID=708132 RepID=UPI001C40721A|nr:methyl-accepting chemotaxis protein [Oligoflexus tunisiensis]
MGGLVFTMMLATLVILGFLFANQYSLNAAQERRYDSYQLANELRKSSEDLTRLARTFVVTGDAKYEKEYFDILDIRNGKAPRPDGRTVPLQTLMRELGFSEEEFSKLKEAETNSNNLVATETIAMNAMKTPINSSDETESAKVKAERANAIKIMHDQKYHDNKVIIMKPIDEFERLLEKRTLQEVKKFEERGSFLLILIGIFAVLTTILFAGVYFQITHAVTHQLGADPAILSAALQQITLGDTAIDFGTSTSRGVFHDLQTMVKGLNEKAEQAEAIADGNLTNDIRVLSDKDRLGKSFSKMNAILKDVISRANQAANFVLSGSSQVSSASQSLSSGANEQASAIEEISSSVTEISTKVKINADAANSASETAAYAQAAAEHGRIQIENTLRAMQDIKVSSLEISKIIKVIDDIAFQTNLLALNAAVEAARAGRHGRGFAVVSEEVRNLAGRSAKAARETTELIESSSRKVASGLSEAEKTTASFKEIVDGSLKVAEIVKQIATASREQATGIAQIAVGIEQVNKVTQTNSANAEETASASEELASQAQELQRNLSYFKLDRSQVDHASAEREGLGKVRILRAG